MERNIELGPSTTFHQITSNGQVKVESDQLEHWATDVFYEETGGNQ